MVVEHVSVWHKLILRIMFVRACVVVLREPSDIRVKMPALVCDILNELIASQSCKNCLSVEAWSSIFSRGDVFIWFVPLLIVVVLP